MHILFLTWKDIRHPHAGGAEKVMYEYARGLVSKGYQVTWLASAYRGAKSEELYDGVNIIRRYTNHTIWMGAWWWYLKFKRTNKIDIIIDEAGGWPLLSPLYEKDIPIYFFMHHIGDREFDAYPSPLGQIAWWVYRRMISLYRHTSTIAVSRSTRDELISDFGFLPTSITVIENTTTLPQREPIDPQERRDDIVYLGRLTRIKRPDHAIRAFSLALASLPEESRLHIIGNAQDEPYVRSLEHLTKELRIQQRVILHGFLDTEAYDSLLRHARCMLVPSEKEGYGLIVLEANAYGIPVIAYDVAGLRDSVDDGQNGILIPDGDIPRMGEEIVKMFANEGEYRTLSQKSLEHVQSIPTWKEQIEKLEKLISKN